MKLKTAHLIVRSQACRSIFWLKVPVDKAHVAAEKISRQLARSTPGAVV
jgi:hypothetical protein